MTAPSDVLNGADPSPAATPPTLYIWDEMVKEYGNPLAVIDPPLPEPSIVAELDQPAVAKKEDRPTSPPKPRPTKKRTDRPTWPKMPE